MSGMSDSPRTSRVWTPRSAAVVITATLSMIACATAGAIMLFASNPAPVAASAASETAGAAAATAIKLNRQKEKPNRSKSRYHPKNYKGPLPKPGNQAPVAVAHPPQEASSPTSESTGDGSADDHSWPGEGRHHGHHHHGGGRWPGN